MDANIDIKLAKYIHVKCPVVNFFKQISNSFFLNSPILYSSLFSTEFLSLSSFAVRKCVSYKDLEFSSAFSTPLSTTT